MLHENVVGFTQSLELCCRFLIARVLVWMRSKGELTDSKFISRLITQKRRSNLLVGAFDYIERRPLVPMFDMCQSHIHIQDFPDTYIFKAEDLISFDDRCMLPVHGVGKDLAARRDRS